MNRTTVELRDASSPRRCARGPRRVPGSCRVPRRATSAKMPTSSTAPIESSVNVASHAAASDIRGAATCEITPATATDTTANASRSAAIDAAEMAGGTWSASSRTFSGSPVGPRTVKKLMASAARRTRKSREKLGPSGHHGHGPRGKRDRPTPRSQQVPRHAGQEQHRATPTPAGGRAPGFQEGRVSLQRQGEEGDADEDRDPRGDARRERHRVVGGRRVGEAAPGGAGLLVSSLVDVDSASTSTSSTAGALVATSSRSMGAPSSRSSTA